MLHHAHYSTTQCPLAQRIKTVSEKGFKSTFLTSRHEQTSQLSNSKKQNHSSETNSHLVSKEIPYLTLPLVPILTQINPVHSLLPYPVTSILILSYLCLALPSCLFPLCFLLKILYAFHNCCIHATWPAHLVVYNFISKEYWANNNYKAPHYAIL